MAKINQPSPAPKVGDQAEQAVNQPAAQAPEQVVEQPQAPVTVEVNQPTEQAQGEQGTLPGIDPAVQQAFPGTDDTRTVADVDAQIKAENAKLAETQAATLHTPVVFNGNQPKNGFSDREKVPSDWALESDGDGIIARNNATGRVFQGTMVEFNKMLRG